MVKETIYWFFGSALVLFFSVNDAKDDEKYFKKILLKNVRFILILEVIINLYVFSFWLEMILVPTIMIIAIMSAVAETDAKLSIVKKVLDFVLAAYGIFLAIYVTISVVNDYNYLLANLKPATILMPPLLSASFLPFIYLFALYLAYEMLFVRIEILIKEDILLTRFAKRKLFQCCKFNLIMVQKHKKIDVKHFMDIKSKEDVINLVRMFKGGNN